MGHPNLSNDLNAAIDGSTTDNGFFVKDLPVGTEIHVNTRNSKYVLTLEEIGESGQSRYATIKGNNRFFQTPERVYICGSTWGGSCIKLGWLGVGMHMEVGRGDEFPVQDRLITMSETKLIQIVRKDVETLGSLAATLAILAGALLGGYAWLTGILRR